jgi:hypothetical protein
VTAVSGSWIVPTVTGPPTGSYDSSVWAGIDGYGNNTVEQTGIAADRINGSPIYYVRWEMYSSGAQQTAQVISSMPVDPGDSITASVRYISSGAHAGQFYLSIVDNSRQNDSFSIYSENPNPGLAGAWSLVFETPVRGPSAPESRVPQTRLGTSHLATPSPHTTRTSKLAMPTRKQGIGHPIHTSKNRVSSSRPYQH